MCEQKLSNEEGTHCAGSPRLICSTVGRHRDGKLDGWHALAIRWYSQVQYQVYGMPDTDIGDSERLLAVRWAGTCSCDTERAKSRIRSFGLY